MANKDVPRGLRPHGRILRVRPYTAGSTCYPGDAVSLASDGQVDPASTGALIGVAANKADAGQTVMVYDDPNQLFTAQADDAVAAADIGLNCDLQGHASPSTAYKVSGMEVDSSTKNTTSTLSVQLLAIDAAVDNSVNAANNDVIIRINSHQLNGAGLTGV